MTSAEPMTATASSRPDLTARDANATAPQPAPSFGGRAGIVTWIALAVAVYFALAQLGRWPGRLQYPGEEDAAEGTQLSEMVHLRQGIHIYRVPSDGEFDSAIYGPLCYLLGAAVVSPQHPAYLPLRLLSLFGTLGLALVAGIFVAKLTGKKSGGVLAAAMLLATVFIGRYGISARADIVALLLAFGGFVVFYLNREGRRVMFAAAALMLLSFFYKQQFIGAPAAVFLHLAFTKQFRRALEFASALAFGGAILITFFSFVVFPHQAFLIHFFSYNHLPFEKGYVLPEVLMFAVPLFIPLLGSADFLDRKKDSLLTCYFMTSVAGYFLLLLSSGSGADTNRCLEAAIVLTCFFAARIATSEKLLGGLAWTAAIALTLGVVSLLSSAFVVRKITAEDFAADAAVQNYLKNGFSPGTSILGYYAGDPLRAGLAAPVTNLWHYAALIRSGKLSDQDILTRINSAGYGAILLDFDLGHASDRAADFYTTQSMRDAIAQNYQQVTRLKMPAPELTRYTDGNIYVWTPRSGSQRHATGGSN